MTGKLLQKLRITTIIKKSQTQDAKPNAQGN